MESTEFIKEQLHDLHQEFPLEVFTYYFDNLELNHIVEVASTKFFEHDLDFQDFEKYLYKSFNSKFPGEFLVIQSREDLVGFTLGAELLRVGITVKDLIDQIKNDPFKNLYFHRITEQIKLLRSGYNNLKSFKPLNKESSRFFSDQLWHNENSKKTQFNGIISKEIVQENTSQYASAA